MAKRAQPRKPSHPRTAGKASPPTSNPRKPGASRTASTPDATTASATRKSPTKRSRPSPPSPPARKKAGRSIIDQRSRPWGLIGTSLALVAVAAAVITIAATRGGDTSREANGGGKTTAWTQPEAAAARAITGVKYQAQPDHKHRDGTISYNTAPPTGGDHSGYWADCAGTVYAQPIASENAVHALEHGAVWITYRPGLPADQIRRLAALVDGVDRMALSPYPRLPAAISVQAWNYQFTTSSASDPRIAQFVAAVGHTPKTTPEYGATCSQPSFKTNPSRYGRPRSGPGMP